MGVPCAGEAHATARSPARRARQVEELKRDYYHRKNRRERWEEHRKAHPTNTMDYRGWELFEEDPDEDLWNVRAVDEPARRGCLPAGRSSQARAPRRAPDAAEA